MRRITMFSVIAFMAAAALVRAAGQAPAAGQPAAPKPTCPQSGYAPPYYAQFGQNGGDGNTAVELASPCVGKDVREVAETLGMNRLRVQAVKNTIGEIFRVDGTMADGTGMAKLTNTEFQMAYYLPAMRETIRGTKANGQPLRGINVFAGKYAWNEAQEGRGATAAMNTLADRRALVKLTPAGAMWSVIEAEGHTVVTKTADGKTVLTGTSPYDGIEVAITVQDITEHPKLGPHLDGDVARLPVAVTAKADGHTYGATFADYRGDIEPDNWYIFPTTINWTLDGKPLANMKVTYYRSNPYIVFPIPAVVNPTAPQQAGGASPAGGESYIKQGTADYMALMPGGPLAVEKAVTTYRPAMDRVSPQDAFAALYRSNAPTPRDADGHPDLSGNWGVNFPNPIGDAGMQPARRLGAFEPDQAAMQRAAQWNKPLYKPEYWDKVRSLDFSIADVDPGYGCGNHVGVPRQNVPARIVQKDKQIWLLNGVENAMRILPLDATQRPAVDSEFSTYNGMGLARWDGDTLVVESIGFNGASWFGWEGYFHTDQMKVTERFRRQGDLLFYDFIVDDPQVLTEPWTSITYVRRLAPNSQRQDEATPCDERDFGLLADPYLRG